MTHENSDFIKACYQKKAENVPIWYMRQAGRYDPDYLKIKEKFSLLEICQQPELAAQVTMIPVKKLGVDAAILYSDIMNPLSSLGVDFDIVPDVGPVVFRPIQSIEDVEQLKSFEAEKDLSHVLQTIEILKKELNVPLIGFTGGPFTLASYMIEGSKPSNNHFLKTKALMHSNPEAWNLLMSKLSGMIVQYLEKQIQYGVNAVQVFDSWIGALSETEFSTFVLSTLREMFQRLSQNHVPKIYFGLHTRNLLSYFNQLDIEVVGLDWRIDFEEGRKQIHHTKAIQGNFNPNILKESHSLIRQHAVDIINKGVQHPGFIFNVGEGLTPDIPIDNLIYLTNVAKEYSNELIHGASNFD